MAREITDMYQLTDDDVLFDGMKLKRFQNGNGIKRWRKRILELDNTTLSRKDSYCKHIRPVISKEKWAFWIAWTMDGNTFFTPADDETIGNETTQRLPGRPKAGPKKTRDVASQQAQSSPVHCGANETLILEGAYSKSIPAKAWLSLFSNECRKIEDLHIQKSLLGKVAGCFSVRPSADTVEYKNVQHPQAVFVIVMPDKRTREKRWLYDGSVGSYIGTENLDIYTSFADLLNSFTDMFTSFEYGTRLKFVSRREHHPYLIEIMRTGASRVNEILCAKNPCQSEGSTGKRARTSASTEVDTTGMGQINLQSLDLILDSNAPV